MDSIQYQELLETQNAVDKALYEQKDKAILDSMKNKTNRRLMMSLLQGFHLLKDLNKDWMEVFDNKTGQNDLLTVANLAKANKVLSKQGSLLQGFNDWLVEERTIVKAANISKEGWSAAEAMKQSSG